MKNPIYALCFLLFGPLAAPAQLNPEPIQIPMRDGQTLAANLYLPNQSDAFPVILIQTPYNKELFNLSGLPLGIGHDIAGSDYAFVIVDWRCFYGSLPACTLNPNRGEDGYDAVEWIADQPWSDGRIGTWGPSALGNVQFETAREQPPHLVCAVPEVASPQTSYRDYYPGGAIRTEYLETLSFLFGAAGFGLVIDNPHYNLLWQIVENTTMYPEDIAVPMLLVGGWYDHNTYADFLLIDTLATNSPPAVKELHKILVGPWVHGGTGPANLGSLLQGELTYPAAENYNDLLALDFFDHHLRDIDNGWEGNARYLYFQMGENEWRHSDIWPPLGTQPQTLFLHADGSIQLQPASGSTDALSFNYDPSDPSPTIGGKTLSLALDQGPYDQAPLVESRPDALIFTTAPFEQAVELQGSVKGKLYVSSDRKDTDFTLRLTEVYPDGRSMLLGEAVQRMRFREGYAVADTAFMATGEVYPITFEFDPLANTFLPGQSLRLVVSSSNYPRYNRNMNTGGEMYPNGNTDTLVNALVAENTVHLNALYPSQIELPLAAPITALQAVAAEKTGPSAFPNPSSGEFQLMDLPAPCRLELFDSSGRLWKVEQAPAESHSLRLNELPAGLYFLRIFDRQQRSTSLRLRKE